MAADFATPPPADQQIRDQRIQGQLFKDQLERLDLMYRYIPDLRSLKREHPITLVEIKALIDQLDGIGMILLRNRQAIMYNPEQEMQWYQRE